MKKKKLINIFLSSIRQDIGKTTVSLGLYKALTDAKYKTTFMKPVGQKVVHVGDHEIDKDSYLISEVFHCSTKYQEMSPVAIAESPRCIVPLEGVRPWQSGEGLSPETILGGSVSLER